ncbi:MAG TPA: hypothetical protein ENI80_08710 [Acidiferrobacteraceae bacterium]|nr:hypothetical protein [Acidiferrobacteraceae bacterium]
MAIDCTRFTQIAVIDTCSIWNILSSRKLTAATKEAKRHFTATSFVYYEALYKPRTTVTKEDVELQERLRNEKDKQLFGSCSLDITDLQQVDILDKRMRLGKGELSSIAFAKKAGLGFMTDDQKARKLGSAIVDSNCVHTTPQLFGWLFFKGYLVDSDRGDIMREHEHFSRPLRPFFEEMYNEALRCRLMAR